MNHKKDTMKIVQINAVYEYSSTGRTTMEMHEYLLAHDMQSYVFCTNHHIPEKQVYKIGDRFDHSVHSLMSRLTDNQGGFSYLSTKKLINQLEQISPDVIVLRNLHANYVNLPLLLKYIAKHDIATIIVLHDVWTFTGHCCYYTAHNCDSWLKGCGNCPALHDYNTSWFFDNSKSNFKLKQKLFGAIKKLAVIGVSDWVINEAKRSPIFTNATIMERIYNWIDLEKFHPVDTSCIRAKLGLNDKFVVVSVAQGWNEKKGLFKIFDAAKLCPEDRFVLVGRMDYTGELPENVISVGVTSSTNELASYYSMADALLVCSLQETFGKVSAEALACGTPVIANDSTANPEIAGAECGISVDTSKPEEVAKAIAKIKACGKLQYQEKCVARANEEFDFNKQIMRYMDLFKRL